MNHRKKDVGATQSTESKVGSGTKDVEQIKGYRYTKYEQYNFYFIWYIISVMKGSSLHL